MVRLEKNVLTKNFLLILLVALCLVACSKKGVSNSVLTKAIAAEFARESGDTVTNVVIEKTFGHFPGTLRSEQDIGMITQVRARIVVVRRPEPYRYAYEVFVANSDGHAVAKETLDEAFAMECANNLRMIEGVIHQWALEKEKPPTAWPHKEDIFPYLKDNRFPECPSGGFYVLQQVKDPPICMSGGMGHNRRSY